MDCIFFCSLEMIPKERRHTAMNKNTNNSTNSENEYDDGNIPDVDLPQDCDSVEPLPESTRPRKDGPGGD